MTGTGLNEYAFQGVSQVILKFYFQGKRKVVASHLCESSDLDAELLGEGARVLRVGYGQHVVRKVELLTYDDRNSWIHDEWPEGLKLLDEAGTPTVLSAKAEPEEEEEPEEDEE